jgi:predicted ArsR family transcriptional regulator
MYERLQQSYRQAMIDQDAVRMHRVESLIEAIDSKGWTADLTRAASQVLSLHQDHVQIISKNG